jgi:drug/metabolite transporter (DMT)-like permease
MNRSPFAAVPPALRGPVLMLIPTFLITGMQALVRLAGNEVPPFEVAFFRNLFGLVVVLPLLYRTGFGILKTKHLKLHAVRGALQTSTMLLYFTALTLNPLAQNIALSFTAPLFATVLAIIVLGERAGWRRWAALVVGFVGAWTVIRPGFEAVSVGALLVVLSSSGWAVTMIIIKYLGRTESSLTITVYMGLFMAPLSAIPAAFVWQWPDPVTFAMLVAIGCLGGLGQLAMAQAFKEADTTAVMPFDFLRLIWAAALGFVVFAEVPDVWTWIGGSLIFGATTHIAFREARLKRAPAALQPATE